MSSGFNPISLDDSKRYHDLLAVCPSRASDYSFANVWGWATHYGLEWKFTENLCWIRQTSPVPCYWAPVGDWARVENWRDFSEMAPGEHIIRVPESLALLWREKLGERVQIEEARGQWDYLYLAEELCALSGNRFHKKKNLLKQFQKNYDYEYRMLTSECVAEVLAMQEEWCRWRDCEASEALIAEDKAITRVLTHWSDMPGLSGGIIRVDGNPMAYTIGEALSQDVLVIHFEKAANAYKGAYQAINWLYANDVGKEYTYINREQDLGDEGLRRAKMSYNPADFVRKSTVKM